MDSRAILFGRSASSSVNNTILLDYFVVTLIKNFTSNQFFDLSMIDILDIGVFLGVVRIPVLNFCLMFQQAKAVFMEKIFFAKTL